MSNYKATFIKVRETFQAQMYVASKAPGETIPLLCNIHDSFGGLEKDHHNCLGCNFAEMTNAVTLALERAAIMDEDDLSTVYFDYLLWLYLFVERMEMVFKIIELPKSYWHRNFDVFKRVRRWANFIKHPGYFILVHHPEFFLEGDKEFQAANFQVIIDTSFVVENFGSDEDSKSLRQQLSNKKGVAVLFPEPLRLTAEFCDAAKRFVSVVCENRVYKEILNEQSTYENYFKALDEGHLPVKT